MILFMSFFFFFFNDTATTEIYTLSPTRRSSDLPTEERDVERAKHWLWPFPRLEDRKSTRLNSSHEWISYAVFCLKKKKKQIKYVLKRERTTYRYNTRKHGLRE